MQEITSKEWNAILLTVQGLSDVKAYKQTFPNAKDSTANAQACRYFKRIREKLTATQELDLFNLGRGRFYKELENRLNAETPIFYQGKKIDTIPDNVTRLKATEILAKVNEFYNSTVNEITKSNDDKIIINFKKASEV